MIEFVRSNFFPIKKKYSISDLIINISKFIYKKKITNDFEIQDISTPNNLKNYSIVFLFSKQNFNNNHQKKNLLYISNDEGFIDEKFNYIIVNDINQTYNFILNLLYCHEDSINYHDEFEFINGSHISKFCFIDQECNIGKNCLIGRGVRIGKNSIIKNNVVIKNAIINQSVTICDNTTIGSTGFGFSLKSLGSDNINPQIGIVYIDNYAHIGSNCSIDRGKIDITYIGKNTMIDNLVHIAHNVIIGKNVVIAGQTGIAGSARLGDNVVVGGQVGITGHITIGNNVIISAKSGVTKNIKERSVVAGFPAIDIKLWKKKIIKEKYKNK